MPDIDDLPSLQRQLENRHEALLLIRERQSEYALSTDIPLDLVREERETLEEIAALEAQIEALEHRKPPAAAAPATAAPVARPKAQPASTAKGRTRSSSGFLLGIVVLVLVTVLLIMLPRLLNRGTGTSTREGQATATSQVESRRPQSAAVEMPTPTAIRPAGTSHAEPTSSQAGATQAPKIAAASATPAAAFAPASPTPTLAPPVAINLTNNREGRYDDLALLFDQNDTLHLVFSSPLLRSLGDYFHQQLPAGGAWTQAESLTNGFEVLWSNLELRRNAEGQLCVLWAGVDKSQGEAWYMRCQTGPDWLQRKVTQWRPKTFDTRGGFSAIIRPDGQVDAAFVRVGNGAVSFNDIADIVQDHLASVWYGVDLERDAAGNYHVLWHRGGEPYSLQYRRSSDSGRTWTQTERLTGEDDEPDIRYSFVADLQNAVHLVWEGFSKGIYYRRWTPEVGWSELTELSQGVNGRSPQVAVDIQGLARVVWDASPGIWYAAQAADGSWQAPRLIATGGNGLDYGSSRIAVDAEGRSHVVWLHDKDIYYTVVD